LSTPRSGTKNVPTRERRNENFHEPLGLGIALAAMPRFHLRIGSSPCDALSSGLTSLMGPDASGHGLNAEDEESTQVTVGGNPTLGARYDWSPSGLETMLVPKVNKKRDSR